MKAEELTADLSVRSEIGMRAVITPEDVEVAAVEEAVEGAEVSGTTTGRIAEAIATEMIKTIVYLRMNLDGSNVRMTSVEDHRVGTEGLLQVRDMVVLQVRDTVALPVVGTTARLLQLRRRRQK